MTEGGVFETMRAVDGRIPLWPHHHARLLRSGYGTIPTEEEIRKRLPDGVIRVRLDVDETGWSLLTSPIDGEWHGLRISVWPGVFRNPDPSRKRRDRGLYERVFDSRPEGADDVLLLTADGHVAETTRMNVFFLKDGILHTPDESCSPLHGVARRLVQEWSPWPVIEGRFGLDELLAADAVFGSNAVRGLVWFVSVNGRQWNEPASAFMDFRRDFHRRAYG